MNTIKKILKLTLSVVISLLLLIPISVNEGTFGKDKENIQAMTSVLNRKKRAVSRPVDITEMTITDSLGNNIVGSIGQWDSFRINVSFDIPDNVFKAGDTTEIKLPKELKFKDNKNFNLEDPAGDVVATANIDPTNKTITLTYMDYVQKHSGVKGDLHFYATVDANEVTVQKVIPVKIEIEGQVSSPVNINYDGPGTIPASDLDKSGLMDAATTGNRTATYFIAINRNMQQPFNNAVIKDKLLHGPSVTIIPGTIVIEKGTWNWNATQGEWVLNPKQNVTGSYSPTFETDNSGFLINLGNIGANEGFLIKYQVEINYDPSDGEIFKNEATLSYDGTQDIVKKSDVIYYEAGGQAEGYNCEIKIIKTNQGGDLLPGAEFEIVRDRNNTGVGRFTTDINGSIQVQNLLRDNYTIKEIKAPTGYVLSGAEIKVSPQDFGTTKSVVKTIVNKKKPDPTTPSTTTKPPGPTMPSTPVPIWPIIPVPKIVIPISSKDIVPETSSVIVTAKHSFSAGVQVLVK